MPEHAIGSIAQIPKGEGRTFEVDGTKIAVFHTHAGEVFATQARLPAPRRSAGRRTDRRHDARLPAARTHLRHGNGQGHGNDDCLTVYPAEVTADGHIVLDAR